MNAAPEMPHSIDAEENLISCCVLDGADVIARCVEAQIRPETFYLRRHQVIFAQLLELFRQNTPISTDVLAIRLIDSGQLETVGGHPALTQITSRLPTTSQAGYFIDTVRLFSIRRDVIIRAQAAIEQARRPATSTDELINRVQSQFSGFGGVTNVDREMKLQDLLSCDTKTDPDCLMGNRFLGRSGGCVIVAPSGVGKSVLSVQFAACAALGRPFFGLRMVVPMRVLYVQAEDDFGDVAEALQGFTATHPVNAEGLEIMRRMMRIVRWNDAVGSTFLSRLRREHLRHPFDLVIINPLFSFCGCSVSEQSEMSAFLRNGLNPILNDTRAAAIIVHHTNKPPADSKNQADANSELRYSGSGSAELTNWARAYITLQPVKSAGETVVKMSFSKRGNRAGIVDQNGKPTTSVLIEHSPLGLCWIPSNYSSERSAGGKFAVRFSVPRAAKLYDAAVDWSTNEQVIALDQGVDPRTVRRYRDTILDTAA